MGGRERWEGGREGRREEGGREGGREGEGREGGKGITRQFRAHCPLTLLGSVLYTFNCFRSSRSNVT